ncbi:MAG: hypothetical protein EOP84_15265 [Verrucomicrobiaceae bacterium]|nr:MAG: hypothetical protein EOP84_15265 [Verrucomicrobiaceae bacterium]
MSGIEPRFSFACAGFKLQTLAQISQSLTLEKSLSRQGELAARRSFAGGPALPPGRQWISEFARRIEESAESSTVWGRLCGEELSGLRRSFRNLLVQILEELEPQETGSLTAYHEASLHAPNSDIVLACRVACLVSEALAVSNVDAASRVEVGFSVSGTELICFVGDESAGVIVRRNDNLFALCSNGGWRGERIPYAPSFTAIQRVVENHGGQLSLSGTDTVNVKVSLTI